MQVNFQLNEHQVGEVQASLTITMPIKDWERLADNIPDQWPGWNVRGAIRDCVRQARATFAGKVER